MIEMYTIHRGQGMKMKTISILLIMSMLCVPHATVGAGKSGFWKASPNNVNLRNAVLLGTVGIAAAWGIYYTCFSSDTGKVKSSKPAKGSILQELTEDVTKDVQGIKVIFNRRIIQSRSTQRQAIEFENVDFHYDRGWWRTDIEANGQIGVPNVPILYSYHVSANNIPNHIEGAVREMIEADFNASYENLQKMAQQGKEMRQGSVVGRDPLSEVTLLLQPHVLCQ